MAAKNTLKTYYLLTKPGIIYGNAIAALGGFLLASRGQIDLWLLVAVLLGTALIIGSGCVFNNYVDRNIDRKMSRTKSRALASGTVSDKSALVYASLLSLAGFVVLALGTNTLTVLLGAAGLFFYVVVYGAAKRHGPYGTLVGSIPGALPPVAGYAAVTGRLDAGALLLFLILVFWQMPHFYAIAIFRSKDYAAANIPVLPVTKGMPTTKRQIFLYAGLFVAATFMLTVTGYTGYTYLVIMALLGIYWLRIIAQGFKTSDNNRWARRVFGASLMALLVFSLMISVDILLP